MVVIEVPSEYGWVILGAGIGNFVTGQYMAGAIMSARKKFDVKYPNLYATPGYHKKADDFNRYQRGHQNYIENIGPYVTLAMLGGLKYPIANAIGSVLYMVGSVLYLKGYVDTSLDVTTARYKKGGGVKWIGFFISLYSTGALAYSLIKSS